MTDECSVRRLHDDAVASGSDGAVASSTQDEILNAEEVARYLKIPVKAVYEHARSGVLPGFKLGKHWRFFAQDIKLALRKRAASAPRKEGLHGSAATERDLVRGHLLPGTGQQATQIEPFDWTGDNQA
jgi:excisionase family DNA binding protein